MPQERKHNTNSARQAAYRLRQARGRQAEQSEKGLPSLPQIASLPGQVRWRTAIRYALALLTLVKDEMIAYFDARSETWQESDRGAAHQERIDTLEELLSTLDELAL
jgi:hypothetical protein